MSEVSEVMGGKTAGADCGAGGSSIHMSVLSEAAGGASGRGVVIALGLVDGVVDVLTGPALGLA